MADADIDRALLERARAGSAQAHEVLYRTYARMVFTLAYRMLGSRQAAEDVVQDSFVEVIRKVPDYRGEGDIRGWIKRIAVNKCLSHLRSPWIARRAADPRRDDAASTLSGAAGPVEPARLDDAARDLGRQQELARGLAALTPTARAVVWLHDVEGYTHSEIGRLMGRSTSFSKSQLARAYRDLRAILESAPADTKADGTDRESDETDRESEPCLGTLKTV